MTFGACAKHPNFPMINCPMCESEKPLTMYNKEALRKELEDACKFGYNKPRGRTIDSKVEPLHLNAINEYINSRLAALDDGKIKTENMSNLKLADFPVLVEMEKGIKMIPFGTVEYWKQRCINREKMDDPTYSDFERSNCQHFHRLLVNKQK